MLQILTERDGGRNHNSLYKNKNIPAEQNSRNSYRINYKQLVTEKNTSVEELR